MTEILKRLATPVIVLVVWGSEFCQKQVKSVSNSIKKVFCSTFTVLGIWVESLGSRASETNISQ
jgi:hypothetical protein